MSDKTEPQVAQLNIGEFLSSKRHQIHNSIDDVSSQMKLPRTVVEKLESNQFSEIGTPVYVRGYLGLYAKHLGLDAAYVLEQYNIQNPAEDIAIRPSAGTNFNAPRRKTKRNSKTLSLLVVGMVMGGLAYGYSLAEKHWTKNTPTAIENTNNTGEPIKEQVNTVLDEAKAAQSLANDVLSGDNIQSTTSLIKDLDLDDALLADGNVEQIQNVANNPSEAVTVVTPDIKLESTPQSTNIEPEEQQQETQPAKPVIGKVAMTFKEECWVEILDADNKKLTARIYSADKKLNVSGKEPLTIIVGSPKSVASIKYNGSAIKLKNYKIGNIKYQVPKRENNE